MKQIKYFVGGIVFYIVAIPLIESIAETLTTLLEIPKGKASLPVLKLSKEIQELQVEQSEIDTHVMGFDIKSSDDYDLDDDDLDDKIKNLKSKI